MSSRCYGPCRGKKRVQVEVAFERRTPGACPGCRSLRLPVAGGAPFTDFDLPAVLPDIHDGVERRHLAAVLKFFPQV